MNLPDSLSFDTWHMIVNCFACAGPSSPVTVYSGTCMSFVVHNSCKAPTAFSCSMPLYGDVMSDTSSIPTVSGSAADVTSCVFNLLRRHLAASCFASFFDRPLPMASKNSHINAKHYLSWILRYVSLWIWHQILDLRQRSTISNKFHLLLYLLNLKLKYGALTYHKIRPWC